jgi:uncharacterized membrane protein YhaH (DUF805 family)
VVGFVGLLGLLATTAAVLWRRRDGLGRAALMVFLFEVAFALTGIFWLAGTLTMPMLVVGLAIGDDAEQSANEVAHRQITASP